MENPASFGGDPFADDDVAMGDDPVSIDHLLTIPKCLIRTQGSHVNLSTLLLSNLLSNLASFTFSLYLYLN